MNRNPVASPGPVGRGRPLDAARIERWIKFGSLALSLMLALGLTWVVLRADHGARQRVAAFLSWQGPLAHGGVLELGHTEQGRTWRAWADCYGSAQGFAVREPASFRRAGPSGLAWAAQQVRRHLSSAVPGADTGEDLARGLLVWPTAQVWLDTRRGVLVAMDEQAHGACVLVSDALITP